MGRLAAGALPADSLQATGLRGVLAVSARSLVRARGHAIAVVTAAALGAGAALPVFSLRSTHPPPSPYSGDAAVARLLSGDWPAGWGTTIETPSQQAGVGALRELLVALAALALAMACATVAALVLSRGVARRREVAVRAALGAAPLVVAREMALEALLLAATTAAVGLALSLAGSAALVATRPELVRAWLEFTPRWAALVALGAPALAVLLFAPIPAVGAASWRLARTLGAGARATASPGEGALRHALAVAQLAAALCLLLGAGLLLRGGGALLRPRAHAAVRAVQADGGPTLMFEVRPNAPAAARAYEATLHSLRAVPGVAAASVGSGGAWMGDGAEGPVQFTCPRCAIDGVATPVVNARVQHHVVGPGFAGAVGIDAPRGQDFADDDAASGEPVALINRRFERLFQGMTDPVGQSVRIGVTGRWYRIVGVLPEVGTAGLGAASGVAPAVYLPLARHPPGTAQLFVRLTGAGAAGAVRAAVDSIGRGVGASVTGGGTFAEARARVAAPLRWGGGAALALALVALLLAAHGTGAVALDEVQRRRRELAVRRALGASPARIVGYVTWRGVRRVAWGAAWATGGVVLVAWLLERTSEDLPRFDWRIAAVSFAIVGGASLLAGIRAAHLATRVPPAEALRED